MARGRETFEKRRLQKVRQERKAEKATKREARAADDTGEAMDQDHLMERFRVISEQHSAGALTTEDYDEQRKEIFAALGLGEDL